MAAFVPEDEPLALPVSHTELVYEGAIWNVVRDTFDITTKFSRVITLTTPVR